MAQEPSAKRVSRVYERKSIGEAREVNIYAREGGTHEVIQRGRMLRPLECRVWTRS